MKYGRLRPVFPLADVAPQPDPAATYGVIFGGCCFLLFVATVVVALIIVIRRRNRDRPPTQP